MRVRKDNGHGVSAHVIAGTHVVLLNFDATPAARKGLLGFSIHRTDHTENEKFWLLGFRTFEETEPNPGAGTLVTLEDHPVQAFSWGDYTAKPDHDYTYRIVARYGTPSKLTEKKDDVRSTPVVIRIQTETEDVSQHTHTVFFNRGVAGSQAYARKFGNLNPQEWADQNNGSKAAFQWLSRGLEEAIIGFIDQAKDKSFALHACVYEFNLESVLDAFMRAKKNGAEVRIVFDDRKTKSKKTPAEATETATEAKGFTHPNPRSKVEPAKQGCDMIPRRQTPSYISHNKFIVLLKNGKPIEVWTGSTNFTKGGVFGQSNVGHLIKDSTIAARYHEYWKFISHDPDTAHMKAFTNSFYPDPVSPLPDDSITPVFSPRKSENALDFYVEKMRDIDSIMGFTAAFGVNTKIAKVLSKPTKDKLRYLMLEKEGKTFNQFDGVDGNRITLGAILRHSKTAVGDHNFHGWVAEHLTNLNVHVRYLHTKYMFADPFGPQPLVITGSANFSSASTVKNDENMVIVKGNTRVVDMFLGEFMRLWHHFYFRYIASLHHKKSKKQALQDDPHLKTNDAWTKDYYTKGHVKLRERTLFA